MPFIINLLLTYFLADEEIVSTLISKTLFKKVKSQLTPSEFKKILFYIKRMKKEEFARLPKKVRNVILQSIPFYGTKDVQGAVKQFSPMVSQLFDKNMDWDVFLNKNFNPLYPYRNFKQSIIKRNIKFQDLVQKYGSKDFAREKLFKENFKEESLNDALSVINYQWEGNDHDILGAFFVEDKSNPFFGNCIILTIRGTGEYDFPFFPKATFIEFANRKDFGFAFWSYYYWKVYKGRGKGLILTSQGIVKSEKRK